MSRFRGPFAAARKYLLRFSALACVLVYALHSADVERLKPLRNSLAAAVRISEVALGSSENIPASQAAMGSSPEAPAAAIDTSVAAARPLAAADHNHKCCCRHAGNRCEMGCCSAREQAAPGEPCYRECGGGPQAQVPSPLASHLPPFPARYAASIPIAPMPTRRAPAPFSFPSQPREKVPIA